MYDVNDLAFAYGQPDVSGLFKVSADDFKVDEVLGFALSGEGEHQFFRIEKRGLNTEELVNRLAICIGKPIKSISYAGLKDRQALTTQWLSVHCPGEAIPDANILHGDGWRVLETDRHLKKLKTGALEGNQFTLVVREIRECDAVERRLQLIKTDGVPNYFGPQRFGHNGLNMVKAEAVLLNGLRVKDRFLRGIYYSAARSFLFNRILSARVASHNWNKAVSGDVMQLAGKNSIFPIEVPDDIINARVDAHDLSPASLMWGKGHDRVRADALVLQQTALQGFEPWCVALENHGLERAYRAHVLQVQDLVWQWQEGGLILTFQLTSGSYATSVLREVIQPFTI